ncbi:MAG: hypothetical protein A2029_00955 [Chloroflexi bacterium RBG_19FT_COMBO_47_9]|nr:MAG: hypothetical protein A2Y53_02995 [Chloroflexi bacterium RBG_16_47_49]OGO64243.1 MAG: hypothetical protein A2029_00955 [Chloroflexi bacterium RBG_19FT_COMBO_47_9]
MLMQVSNRGRGRTLIQPTSLVLVAIVNNPRDLEIARLLGWYRIPLRTAPKVIAVDYLAFYQTGAFGDEKWRIQYIAPVRGHELTTRAELLKNESDHPRAREEYYKVQLGALERLPQAIRAESWRRITFLYTTGEYLLRATSVNDLVVQSDERQLLWQALRERAVEGYYSQDLPGIELPEEVLSILLGIKEGDGSYGDED